ncbi:TRAP transporter small permease subunit [Gilvimarinus polysaccharolyticus]|uniref:TRAP transporter small permease subunit n=1 Tax=Gilvimarinus polysaccharolyticus TaxID=863921 RepID=UPI001E597832|nr:TRAP transporter small permease subunit [Gilvimarinus polysaccharolyticus]
MRPDAMSTPIAPVNPLTGAPPRLLLALDAITEFTGRATAWLTLIMVIATVAVVVLRRLFDTGSIGLQESVTYMHAAVFLLGAGYALKHGAQVRVDVFYRRFTRRTQAWVDAIGTLVFTLPFAIFVGWISLDFVAGSWHVTERSTDAGGLAYVYLLKSLVLVFAVSLTLAALAELLRASWMLTSAAPINNQHHTGANHVD